MANTSNNLIRDGLRELQQRLPPGWHVRKSRAAPPPFDARLELLGPKGCSSTIALQARMHLAPKDVAALVEIAERLAAEQVLVVLSPYLSLSTRRRLRDRDISFLDLTGNARVVVANPGLYIETQGATEDPNRKERPARSLRGAKAGRIVRALVDTKRPPGVRDLAAATGINAGYVSRVLTFLDSESLITRVGRGRLQSVDWPALLRRWAEEAPLASRGQLATWLDPRGLSALVTRLAESEETYAVSGGLAAAQLAPSTPTRLAIVWIRDALEAATRLRLRQADAGANALLIEPSDDLVFEGAIERDGVWYAAPSQVVVDLLTSPGRGPAEGEQLLSWMQDNEESWRG